MRNLADLFHLKCPNCGQAEQLGINIKCFATVTADGTGLTGDYEWSDCSFDYEWDDESFTQCPSCLTDGTIADFTVETEDGPP